MYHIPDHSTAHAAILCRFVTSHQGHATSYSARTDGIVLSVTKNNVSG